MNQIIAFDESNHGRFPEYFVAVFSQYNSDLIPLAKRLKKRRPKPKAIAWDVLKSLNQRKYTFLGAQENDYDRIPRRRFPGVFMASLIYNDLDLTELEKLDLLLDGEWMPNQKLYIRDHLADLLEMEKKSISLRTGKGLDEKYFLVNLADRLAYALFRHGGSPEKISKRAQRRVF